MHLSTRATKTLAALVFVCLSPSGAAAVPIGSMPDVFAVSTGLIQLDGTSFSMIGTPSPTESTAAADERAQTPATTIVFGTEHVVYSTAASGGTSPSAFGQFQADILSMSVFPLQATATVTSRLQYAFFLEPVAVSSAGTIPVLFSYELVASVDASNTVPGAGQFPAGATATIQLSGAGGFYEDTATAGPTDAQKVLGSFSMVDRRILTVPLNLRPNEWARVDLDVFLGGGVQSAAFGAPPPTISATVRALADPTLIIDPAFPDAAAFRIVQVTVAAPTVAPPIPPAPIPEPSTFVLVGIGAVAMTTLALRRRRGVSVP